MKDYALLLHGQLDLCQPLKDGFFVSNAIDIAKTMSIA
jgi:hypothetical protein